MSSKSVKYNKDLEDKLRAKILSRTKQKKPLLKTTPKTKTKTKTKPKTTLKRKKESDLEIQISKLISELADKTDQINNLLEPIVYSSKPLSNEQRQKLRKEQEKEDIEVVSFLESVPTKTIKKTKKNFIKALKDSKKKNIKPQQNLKTQIKVNYKNNNSMIAKATTEVLENKFGNIKLNVEAKSEIEDSTNITELQKRVLQLLIIPQKITVFLIKTILSLTFSFIEALIKDPLKVMNNLSTFSFYLSILALRFPAIYSMLSAIILFLCRITSPEKACVVLDLFLNPLKKAKKQINNLRLKFNETTYFSNSTKDSVNKKLDLIENGVEKIEETYITTRKEIIDAYTTCMVTLGPELGYFFCYKYPLQIVKWAKNIVISGIQNGYYSSISLLKQLVLKISPPPRLPLLPPPGGGLPPPGGGGGGGGLPPPGGGGAGGRLPPRGGGGGGGALPPPGGGGGGLPPGGGGGGGLPPPGGGGGGGGGLPPRLPPPGNFDEDTNDEDKRPKPGVKRRASKRKIVCDTDKNNQRSCRIIQSKKTLAENQRIKEEIEERLKKEFYERLEAEKAATKTLQLQAEKYVKLEDHNNDLVNSNEIENGLNFLNTENIEPSNSISDLLYNSGKEALEIVKIELSKTLTKETFNAGLNWFYNKLSENPLLIQGTLAAATIAGGAVIENLADAALPGSGVVVRQGLRSAAGRALPEGFWAGASPKENQMDRLKRLAGCKGYSPAFIYTQKNGDVFKGNLKKFRCDHINPVTNAQCKREGYMGYKTCWQHMRSDLKVKIKPSTIPEAGKGLFAECPKAQGQICFNIDDKIVDYNGEKITKKQLEKRYGAGDENTAPYAIQIGRKYEDAALQRSVGSLINFPSANVNPNVELGVENKKVVIRAVSQIKNGEELFADYGDEYQFDSNYKTTR